jgi:hypothetical protein
MAATVEAEGNGWAAFTVAIGNSGVPVNISRTTPCSFVQLHSDDAAALSAHFPDRAPYRYMTTAPLRAMVTVDEQPLDVVIPAGFLAHGSTAWFLGPRPRSCSANPATGLLHEYLYATARGNAADDDDAAWMNGEVKYHAATQRTAAGDTLVMLEVGDDTAVTVRHGIDAAMTGIDRALLCTLGSSADFRSDKWAFAANDTSLATVDSKHFAPLSYDALAANAPRSHHARGSEHAREFSWWCSSLVTGTIAYALAIYIRRRRRRF